MRRIVLFVAVLTAGIGLAAGPAFADYCVEASTPTGGTATVCIPD